MKNMTLKEISVACKGIYYGDDDLYYKEVQGVVIDSRKIEKDYLFIPIRGARADGHNFIPQVMADGALCTLSEKRLEGVNHPYILVDSCEQALKDLAEHYRKALRVKVIGITGSVGKTSTKEMIASILSQHYCVLKTEGNYNNEIGLPLTIFGIREEHDIAILEMGISEFGEMHRLSKMARPDICVITNIGYCHLENLKSREGILKAKSEIFDFMQPDAKIILNGEDDLLSTLTSVKGKTPLFFGVSCERDAYISDVKNLGLDGITCEIHLPDSSFQTHIPIPGTHMVYNAIAGALIGKTLGLTPEEIKAGIESLVPISGRNHIIKANGITIIDDCYNANPVSMKASLDVLSSALGRKAAILGDMGELGADELALHHDVGVHAAECPIDLLCCIGERAKEIASGAESGRKMLIRHFDTKEAFLKEAQNLIKSGDTILVKASHMMDFPAIVKTLQELPLQ